MKEIELKFGANLLNFEDFYCELKKYGTVSDIKELYLKNTYYDSKDNYLLKKGAGVRIRECDGFKEQTIKWNSKKDGALFNRNEENITLDKKDNLDINKFSANARAVFESFKQEFNQDIRLLETIKTDFKRQLFNFTFENAIFEIAYDSGTIFSMVTNKKSPILELEIELKEDANDKLESLIYKLLKLLFSLKTSLTLEPFSKMYKGAVMSNFAKVNLDVGNNLQDSYKSFLNTLGLCYLHDVQALNFYNKSLENLEAKLNEYLKIAKEKLAFETNSSINTEFLNKDVSCFNEKDHFMIATFIKDKLQNLYIKEPLELSDTFLRTKQKDNLVFILPFLFNCL